MLLALETLPASQTMMCKFSTVMDGWAYFHASAVTLWCSITPFFFYTCMLCEHASVENSTNDVFMTV